ncbi:MAG: GGDEF domain-containing protein [Oscillospiraceae bacterium]
MEEIEDPSAPIGVSREYRWTLDHIENHDTTLMFYLVHHYVQVYIGDELVYSLMPQASNQIGKSVSSNWVTVPLYSGDTGKEVRVLATPVYERVREREIEFRIGPFHSLYLQQMKRDLPQLVLAMACLAVGIVIMLVQLAQIWRKKSQRWDLVFLGNFTMLLGIWKIADTRSSPFLFQGNTMVLGYLSIGALFLAGIPLALYLHARFTGPDHLQMLIVSLIASGAALCALFCEVSGIADFRETLPLAHAVVVLMIIVVVTTAIVRRVQRKSLQTQKYLGLILLLTVGAVADLASFYAHKNSSGLVFTILAVLIYALLLFISNLMDTSRMAYTDAHTGLFNKSRWDVLMDMDQSNSEAVGIMMFDLNGLKYINDTMGHEAGDKMIFNFANILHNVIPSTNVICRWGGDEFTVLLTSGNREKVERLIEEIQNAVDAYNASGEKPALYYAVGYALASEFPGLSRKALLNKADERMYLNKKQWYEENSLK